MLEGVGGVGFGCGLFADWESRVPGDKSRFVATFEGVSSFDGTNGGGKGDIEREDIEAECAWYTRIGKREGMESTCWADVSYSFVGTLPARTMLPL